MVFQKSNLLVKTAKNCRFFKDINIIRSKKLKFKFKLSRGYIMDGIKAMPFVTEEQLSSKEIKNKIRSECEKLINFCDGEKENDVREGISFFEFEKTLKTLFASFGCLFIQLFLAAGHERLDYSKWTDTNLYYARKNPIARAIKTVFGEVKYWRTYLIRKDNIGNGFHPLDAVLGLTRDGFSPSVMSLVTRLATRVSFKSSVLIYTYFYDWSPSTESIESLVLGIGRNAGNYMEVVDPPEGDGEVLIIESDGKATPTATEEELNKRRGERKGKKTSCCNRHRSKQKRKKSKRKRRKKGDKSKNGRSITIVVMYTLKRGSDGLLHGPINKIVWASYAPRKVMLAWARRQATKRGFPPDTNKRIHIAVDGEKCLKDGFEKLFPHVTFALDIRHVEEYLWKVGRAFFSEGSDELHKEVEELKSMLYEGRSSELISLLKEWYNELSPRAKRDEKRRDILSTTIKYMESRLDMMNYKEYIDEDLPIASGIVEGAARYVVGERMDCSGMRWIPERAEALLHLRCIELNGDWDRFFDWEYGRWKDKLLNEEKVLIRTNEPMELPDAA
ncbi:hypothetical protein QUF76_07255 [Desulfobacterales bacterium HSG16]|nr:hypothetical protein [Desulfobacterales bacterium HSG16]